MLKKILGGLVALVIVGAIFGGGGDDTSSDDTSTYAEEQVAELEEAGDVETETIEEVAEGRHTRRSAA